MNVNLGFNNMAHEVNMPDGSDYYVEGQGTVKSRDAGVFNTLLVQSMTPEEMARYEAENNINTNTKKSLLLWVAVGFGIFYIGGKI